MRAHGRTSVWTLSIDIEWCTEACSAWMVCRGQSCDARRTYPHECRLAMARARYEGRCCRNVGSKVQSTDLRRTPRFDASWGLSMGTWLSSRDGQNNGRRTLSPGCRLRRPLDRFAKDAPVWRQLGARDETEVQRFAKDASVGRQLGLSTTLSFLPRKTTLSSRAPFSVQQPCQQVRQPWTKDSTGMSSSSRLCWKMNGGSTSSSCSCRSRQLEGSESRSLGGSTQVVAATATTSITVGEQNWGCGDSFCSYRRRQLGGLGWPAIRKTLVAFYVVAVEISLDHTPGTGVVGDLRCSQAYPPKS